MANYISVEHRVVCGHRLPTHKGKCRFIHGHNYKFRIVVGREYLDLNDEGMVCDFDIIKDSMIEYFSKWDHSLLLFINDPMGHFSNFPQLQSFANIVRLSNYPTAEYLAQLSGNALEFIIHKKDNNCHVISMCCQEEEGMEGHWINEAMKE